MDTQDVLGSQFLDLLLDGAQVCPELVALQEVLDHHRFVAWPGAVLRYFLHRRRDSYLKLPLTGGDHGLETRLLVDARPDDVPSLRPPMTERQETQRQAHTRCHGNDEAAGHAPDACRPEEAELGNGPRCLSARTRLNRPDSFRTSRTTELVSLLSRLDPAALGWTAAMSPERPMPWISLRRTDGHPSKVSAPSKRA